MINRRNQLRDMQQSATAKQGLHQPRLFDGVTSRPPVSLLQVVKKTLNISTGKTTQVFNPIFMLNNQEMSNALIETEYFSYATVQVCRELVYYLVYYGALMPRDLSHRNELLLDPDQFNEIFKASQQNRAPRCSAPEQTRWQRLGIFAPEIFAKDQTTPADIPAPELQAQVVSRPQAQTTIEPANVSPKPANNASLPQARPSVQIKEAEAVKNPPADNSTAQSLARAEINKETPPTPKPVEPTADNALPPDSFAINDFVIDLALKNMNGLVDRFPVVETICYTLGNFAQHSLRADKERISADLVALASQTFTLTKQVEDQTMAILISSASDKPATALPPAQPASAALQPISPCALQAWLTAFQEITGRALAQLDANESTQSYVEREIARISQMQKPVRQELDKLQPAIIQVSDYVSCLNNEVLPQLNSWSKQARAALTEQEQEKFKANILAAKRLAAEYQTIKDRLEVLAQPLEAINHQLERRLHSLKLLQTPLTIPEITAMALPVIPVLDQESLESLLDWETAEFDDQESEFTEPRPDPPDKSEFQAEELQPDSAADQTLIAGHYSAVEQLMLAAYSLQPGKRRTAAKVVNILWKKLGLINSGEDGKGRAEYFSACSNLSNSPNQPLAFQGKILGKYLMYRLRDGVTVPWTDQVIPKHLQQLFIQTFIDDDLRLKKE